MKSNLVNAQRLMTFYCWMAGGDMVNWACSVLVTRWRAGTNPGPALRLNQRRAAAPLPTLRAAASGGGDWDNRRPSGTRKLKDRRRRVLLFPLRSGGGVRHAGDSWWGFGRRCRRCCTRRPYRGRQAAGQEANHRQLKKKLNVIK